MLPLGHLFFLFFSQAVVGSKLGLSEVVRVTRLTGGIINPLTYAASDRTGDLAFNSHTSARHTLARVHRKVAS